jgi:Protein of unknown function (DUF1203)
LIGEEHRSWHRKEAIVGVEIEVIGAEPVALAELRATGVDHAGNPVVPFVDREGGWPLRCCLTDSARGDELAIVAWSPFPWRGAYAEIGPIVVHAGDCGGTLGNQVPAQFLARAQVVRPYGTDHRIAYDKALLVEADGSLPAKLGDVLADGEIEFVHVRNVLSGCYSFTARRAACPS